MHACALNPTAAQTNVGRVRLFFRAAESGSAQTRRLRSQDRTSIMRSAMSLGRLMGAALDIAAAAGELRRADRNVCTEAQTVRDSIRGSAEPDIAI